MTVDVRVRRCTLTIRRRDGWSWGAGPQPHIEAALAGVEAALEAALAEAGVAAGVDAHLDEPVRLQFGADGIVTAASWNGLVERLRALDVDVNDAAAAAAAGPSDGNVAAGAAARPSDEAGSAGAPAGSGGSLPAGGSALTGDVEAAGDMDAEYVPGALARVLARWSRGGQMTRIASAWPAELVQTWIAAIAAAARQPGTVGAPAALTADAVDLIAEGVLGNTDPRGPSTRQAADRLLVLLAAITAALGERLPDGATQALAQMRVVGGDAPAADADGATSAPARQRTADHNEPAADADGEAGALARQRTADHNEPAASADNASGALTGQRAATADDDKPIADATHAPDRLRPAPDSADDATSALAQQRTAAADEPVALAPRAPTSRTGTASSSRKPGSTVATTGHPTAPVEQVVPALPLLVLAQLSRIGYVDAIASAAAVVDLPGGGGALGAAVAGKVLPPPGRGWSREPAEAAAVALASGATADQVPEALDAIAAREQELVVILGAALQAAYAEGRSANDELLVWAGEEGNVCGEQEGLLPAAWVASERELDAVLASLGRPPVRRGDDFKALARTLHERPGLPRTDAPALERQLGAAAGTALGLIALSLWGSSGQAATPLLTLERLGDLEARVRRERDGLHVSIPRGQRWLDLRRGGLLELFSVPWLPAGRLEIGTW